MLSVPRVAFFNSPAFRLCRVLDDLVLGSLESRRGHQFYDVAG